MKLRWLGHAAFVIESAALKIFTDPFGEDVPYPRIEETADVVTVSHEHHDHNVVRVIQGDFKTLKGLDEETKKARSMKKEIQGVKFRTIPSYHDDQQGKLRGENAIFVIDIDGLRVAHLGDLGEQLNSDQVEQLGTVNVLMIPVGGYYTIDAQTAKETVELVKPNIVVPMHYKTKYIESWPIEGVEDFLEGMENVVELHSSQASVCKEDLPEKTQVWLFNI